MFCPNCGKDCADSRFCPNCGQPLRAKTADQTFEERKKRLQAEGEPYCPKCLSTHYTANKENRRTIYYRSALASLFELLNTIITIRFEKKFGIECVCLQCGNSWYPKREALHERYREIVLELLEGYEAMDYPALNGRSIRLEEDQLTICQSQGRVYAIPFERITAVDYREKLGPLDGRLMIRDRANKYRPFPSTFAKAKKDKLTVFYDSGYKDSYDQLYTALRSIVKENKEQGLL